MKNTSPQRGSALVYILIAIALLAALTSTFMDSSSQQTSSQNAVTLAAQIKSQADLIVSAVNECILTYPQGDAALAGLTTVGGHNATQPYPLMGSNSYLASPISSNDARYIRCPGNPGNSNNHTALFGGTSGKFLPPPPNLFEEWTYWNHTDGVFFWIITNKTDAFIETALKSVDEKYSKCESQYIDARAGNVAMTTTGRNCNAGYQCLRIWIAPASTAIYPGETGCP